MTSCIIPFPHRRIHSYGYEVTVADSKTHQPIPGAHVSDPKSGCTIAVTDAKGKFGEAPVYGWHFAYLLGPISYSMFPYFDMFYSCTDDVLWAHSVRISAADYKTKVFNTRKPSSHQGGRSLYEFYLDHK